MKISSVDIFVLKEVGADICSFPFAPCVCRINTTAGISGFGEGGISIGTGANAIAHMIEDLAGLIIGMDPMSNEKIWEMLRCRCTGHMSGGGSVVFAAVSALETAMMDIKGKELGVPCWQILGGKHRDHLRCYVSQVQTGWKKDYRPRGKAEEYGEVCRRVKEDGYSAAKINFIQYDRNAQLLPVEKVKGPLAWDILSMVEERLSAVRQACGNEFGIIMENVCSTDITSAVQLAKLAEKYGVMLLEEPVFNFNPELMKVVSGKTGIPLAAGEKI